MIKNKLVPRENDRRRIRRIQQFVSDEFTALITADNVKFKGRVVDFHFEGVRLEFNNNSGAPINRVDSVELYYGNRPISKIERPAVVFTKDNTIALSLRQPSQKRGERNNHRHMVKSELRPIALAPDPIRLKSNLHFLVNNFHGNGLQLETSLSNRHLLKDMTINKLKIMLPGVDTISTDVIIRNASLKENRLIIGTEFLDIDADSLQCLAKFSIFGAESIDENIGKTFEVIKTNFGPVKKLGAALKIENLSNPAETDAVLRVRYLAYREVGIIEENKTPQDMSDEYDKRSIIIVAKINGHVVGTVRLVRCLKPDDKFPLEKDIPFESLRVKWGRSKYFEVSRLAVEPGFQGTDIVFRLYEEIARQIVVNKLNGLCLSRKAQQKSYRQCGFRPVSRSIKHPLLKGETLTVMELRDRDIITGSRMAAISWTLICQDAALNMHSAGVSDKSLMHYFLPSLARAQTFFLRAILRIKKQLDS